MTPFWTRGGGSGHTSGTGGMGRRKHIKITTIVSYEFFKGKTQTPCQEGKIWMNMVGIVVEVVGIGHQKEV